MEGGHDAPPPQPNENMALFLSRCAETAGSSTANEDLWGDDPEDLQDEGDEEIRRLTMEWRRNEAAQVDNNYSGQASVKVDRCAGERWNVWHHDGDGKWAHSVALRMSNGVGFGLHELLTFAEHDARVVANTMSEEDQTALSEEDQTAPLPFCLSATDDPVFVGVRHRGSVNGHCASVLGWNRLDTHVLLQILRCLGPDALWNSGNVCRSWMPLALKSFRTRFGPTKFVAELARDDGLSQYQREVATQRSFDEHNVNSAEGGDSEYIAHRQAVVRGIQGGVLGTSSSANIACASHTPDLLGSSLPVAHTLPVAPATSSSSSHQLKQGQRKPGIGQVGTGSKIILEAGKVQPGNCTDVIAACETLCQGLGKSCWVKKNSLNGKDSSRRTHLKCFSCRKGKPVGDASDICPFFVSCVEGDKATPSGHVRITTCETGHTCTHGKDRKRAVPSRIRELQSDTLESFVPVSGRLGGNAKQLADMILQKDGYYAWLFFIFIYRIVLVIGCGAGCTILYWSAVLCWPPVTGLIPN